MKEKLRFFISASSRTYKEDKLLLQDIAHAMIMCGYFDPFPWYENENYAVSDNYTALVNAISTTNLLVAEISRPSTGVGQQIELAIANKIPVLCLENEVVIDQSDHSMFTRSNNRELMKIVSYGRSNLLEVIQRETKAIKHTRFVKFNFISTPELNAYLDQQVRMHGLSRSQYLRNLILKDMSASSNK